jgi:hypothetical protein
MSPARNNNKIIKKILIKTDSNISKAKMSICVEKKWRGGGVLSVALK